MKNNLIIFNFGNQEVRTVTGGNGEILFVARDIAAALGYVNPGKAVRDLCKGGPKQTPLSTPGGIQQIRVIGEPDVYRLIIGSKLPAAQKFERWIFEEALPLIRKIGSYKKFDPGSVSKFDMARYLLEAEKELKEAHTEIKQLKPKADFATKYIEDKSEWIKNRELAKRLQVPGVGLYVLMSALRKAGLLLKNNTPAQTIVDRGFAFIHEIPITYPDGSIQFQQSTLWTRRGFAYISHILPRLDFRGFRKMIGKIDDRGRLLPEFLPKSKAAKLTVVAQ